MKESVFQNSKICFVLSGIHVTLVLCVCFVDRCLSFCTFSFGHCVVCPSIYRFWLPLWYLQTLFKCNWYNRIMYNISYNTYLLCNIITRRTTSFIYDQMHSYFRFWKHSFLISGSIKPRFTWILKLYAGSVTRNLIKLFRTYLLRSSNQ